MCLYAIKGVFNLRKNVVNEANKPLGPDTEQHNLVIRSTLQVKFIPILMDAFNKN